MNPEISIVIPTLNEADSIDATLDALRFSGDENIEINLVDGTSPDSTVSIAETYDVKILLSERGRGRQLQTATKAASGEILWFVHTDTIAPIEAISQIRRVSKDARRNF